MQPSCAQFTNDAFPIAGISREYTFKNNLNWMFTEVHWCVDINVAPVVVLSQQEHRIVNQGRRCRFTQRRQSKPGSQHQESQRN